MHPPMQRDLTLKDFFPAGPGAPSPYAHVFGPMLQTSPQLLHALQVCLACMYAG